MIMLPEDELDPKPPLIEIYPPVPDEVDVLSPPVIIISPPRNSSFQWCAVL